MTWSRLLLLVLLVRGAPLATAAELAHEDAEARHEASYLGRATGDLDAFQLVPAERPAWPFPPLSIGHTMASYQRYGWEAYFHHGLDIRGAAGTPVLAAVGGEVVNVGNYNGGSRLYWEVAVLDAEGFLWQYHHVDHETIPQAVKDAFADHGSVAAGQLLGEIVEWPVDSFGETYDHVHLNVLGADATYLNPFHFLADLGDDQAPEIVALGLLDSERRPLPAGSPAPAGYALSLEVKDWIHHPHFTVPPYSIEVAVDGQAPETVWRFDSLPGKSSRTAYVGDLYLESATCGNYSCRRATLDLGFVPEGRREFPATPGPHAATVRVRDFAGNAAEAAFEWVVE